MMAAPIVREGRGERQAMRCGEERGRDEIDTGSARVPSPSLSLLFMASQIPGCANSSQPNQPCESRDRCCAVSLPWGDGNASRGHRQEQKRAERADKIQQREGGPYELDYRCVVQKRPGAKVDQQRPIRWQLQGQAAQEHQLPT